MKSCKLYFGELGIGGWVGTAAGRGHEKEMKKKGKKGREKERSKVEQHQWTRKGVQGSGICYYHHEFGDVQRCLVTQSQNHRMVWVGRDLCGSSSPTLLLKKNHLQLAQSLCRHGGSNEDRVRQQGGEEERKRERLRGACVVLL